MAIGARTILSALIVGDDLHLAEVECAIGGVRSRPVTVLRGFLSLPADDARRVLVGAKIAPISRVVLTVPASWCALRPIAINVSSWAGARDEVRRSISGLFPLEPEEAVLSLINREDGAGAYLLAVSKARLDPWITAIERATGAKVDEVLPPHVALMGLGLQQREHAVVLERPEIGQTLAHVLRYGRPQMLAEPREDAEPTTASVVDEAPLYLPDGSSEAPMLSTIAPVDLAVGAAMSRTLASKGVAGAYAPFVGRSVKARSPLLAPATVIAVAAFLVIGGMRVRNARYEAAIERVIEQREEIASEVEQIRRDRAEIERLSMLIDRGVNAWSSATMPITPVIAAAQGAVASDGFLYRVDVDARSTTIKGEAPRSLDVLARLEATEEFQNARTLDPPTAVPDRSLETFSIGAQRTPMKTEARQ